MNPSGIVSEDPAVSIVYSVPLYFIKGSGTGVGVGVGVGPADLVTMTLYTFVAPFSAVTVTFTVFSPLTRLFCTPFNDTFAFASAGAALTVILL